MLTIAWRKDSVYCFDGAQRRSSRRGARRRRRLFSATGASSGEERLTRSFVCQGSLALICAANASRVGALQIFFAQLDEMDSVGGPAFHQAKQAVVGGNPRIPQEHCVEADAGL